MAVYIFDIVLDNDDIDDDLDIKVTDYFSGDKQDTTYITLTDSLDDSDADSDDVWEIKLKSFGFGDAEESGEGPGGDNEIYVDLETFNDDVYMTVQSMDDGDTFYFTHADSYTNIGNIYTISYTGSDGGTYEWIIDLESTNGKGVADIVITCFAKGTIIETYHGPCAVQDLDIGDRVLCGDGQHRLIQWIATRHVPAHELAAHPEFRPIRLRQGCLGHNIPNKDLLVSPQHRVKVSDWRAELMFGSSEVLIPAKYLLNDTAIILDMLAQSVTYYHFMFDSHQTVISNGLETESFHPGETALTGVEADARDELFSLFPSLLDNPESFGPTRLPTLKKFEAEILFAEI